MPDKFAMRLGAIILAGGRSVRMGQPKELLPFGGDTLLGRIGTTLCASCDPVLVLARDRAQKLPPLPTAITVHHDRTPGGGPLPGLAHGLRWLAQEHGFGTEDAALLTGCDLPFLSAVVIAWLRSQLGDADLVMPHTANGPHPLAAIYRLRTLPTIERWLLAGTGSPRQLAGEPGARQLNQEQVAAFDPTLGFLQNINTPADYQAALTRLARDG